MSSSSSSTRPKRSVSALPTASASSQQPAAKKAVKRHVTIAYEPDSSSQKKTATSAAPANWEATWAELETMRALHPAPVDSMGCDAMYDIKSVKELHQLADDAAAARVARYRVLVSLMLSSQTKDTENAKAMQRLIESRQLTVDGIIAIDDAALNDMIRNVGFHNKKVVYLKKTAQMLKDKFDSDVPKTLAELVSLPGVGYKMAHLALQAAWNITLGVSVDTHVHRISARLGWTKNAKTPGQTADQLESWLPHQHWRRINHMLVGHGQTICTPVAPKCADCSLFAKGLCKRVGLGKGPARRKSSAGDDEEDDDDDE